MNDENQHPEGQRNDERGPSTAELLRSVQRGDITSWNSLDHRYRERLTRLLHGKIPSDVRARFGTEDVVQSTLFAAFANLQNFSSDGEEGFRLWMNQILRNRLRTRIRFHRAQRRDASAELGTLDEQKQGREPQPDEREVAEGISRALEGLSRLPEDEQALIRMRFFERASFSQIGDVMGVSESSARRVISALLVKLRQRA